MINWLNNSVSIKRINRIYHISYSKFANKISKLAIFDIIVKGNMMNQMPCLYKEAKAWVKRKKGPDEVIRVIPDDLYAGPGCCYLLYTSFEENPDELGRILFDNEGYWIYDGDVLAVAEQEQLARFIINYAEIL